jgi:hypothetical protein
VIRSEIENKLVKTIAEKKPRACDANQVPENEAGVAAA